MTAHSYQTLAAAGLLAAGLAAAALPAAAAAPAGTVAFLMPDQASTRY